MIQNVCFYVCFHSWFGIIGFAYKMQKCWCRLYHEENRVRHTNFIFFIFKIWNVKVTNNHFKHRFRKLIELKSLISIIVFKINCKKIFKEFQFVWLKQKNYARTKCHTSYISRINPHYKGIKIYGDIMGE